VIALTDANAVLFRDATLVDGVLAPLSLPEFGAPSDMNNQNEVLFDFLVPDPQTPGLTLRAIGIFKDGVIREVARGSSDSTGNELEGLAINDRGDVAGVTARLATPQEDAELDRSTIDQGFISRRDGTSYVMQVFGAPTRLLASLDAINDQGVAVGVELTDSFDPALFLASAAGTSPLQTPVDSVESLRINNQSQVVLTGSATPGGARLGYSITTSGAQVLANLPNTIDALANDLNDSGTIVGSNTDASFVQRGVLWSGPAQPPIDLNTVVHPADQWEIHDAFRINASGLIAARGAVGPVGNRQATDLLLVQAARANLTVSILAPAQAAPEAPVTYAVNLENFGPATANDVRAELVLPQGFTLVGTTGWEQCDTTQSTVTCRANGLAPREQRAFLIDVKAPLATGEFTVLARVLSSTPDPDLGNNERTATTIVVAP